jgi:CRISP-associated protein Cas1
MPFRTLEITRPSELHIEHKQLKIIQEENVYYIPLEDLYSIVCLGSNIRLSSMDLCLFAQYKISFITLDKKYLPASISLPFASNVRQSMIMSKQIQMSESRKNALWSMIVHQKIINQARVLAILGKSGFESVAKLADEIEEGDSTNREGYAAKIYFPLLYPGLNRRYEHPMNSVLNYGYSIIRGHIARQACASGLFLSMGLHHHNEYNTFNLVDDLIEPFRPMMDLLALEVVGQTIRLTKEQRYLISKIIYAPCMYENKKTSIIQAVEYMINSVKDYILEDTDSISCPSVQLFHSEDLI